MSAEARLGRLEQRLMPPPPDAGVLNVFSVGVPPGEPTGVAAVWGGVGREVRHPAGTGMPRPPGGPHEIVRGPPSEV